MKKRVLIICAVILLGFGGYTLAQQMQGRPYWGGPPVGQTEEGYGEVIPPGWTWGPMRPGMMGPGMAGPGMMGENAWGHMGPGSGTMGYGMGHGLAGGAWGRGDHMSIMGSMMRSPELMGTMIALHGETMNIVGEMMRKHGSNLWEMAPEAWPGVHREMLERMGEALSRHGAALKEKAKSVSK